MTDYGYARRDGRRALLLHRMSGEATTSFDLNDAAITITCGVECAPRTFRVKELLGRADHLESVEAYHMNAEAARRRAERRNAALRGQITKLKKRLEAK